MKAVTRAGLRIVATLGGLAGIIVALTATSLVGGADDRSGERRRLERENDALRARLELASSDKPYLLLDLGAQRLRLMDGGAVLRDYVVKRAEIGTPTLAFLPRAAEPWRDVVSEGAKLDPPRHYGRALMLPGASPDDPAEVPVPPPPEEACPAPPRYLIRYAGGFTVEVTQETGPGPGPWRALREKVSAVVDATVGDGEPRLRLVLDAEDAGALYRSFPLDSALIVR